MDITDLILDDHREQRRLFSYLDDIDRSDTRAIGAVWKRLSTFLEVHAAAEEALFYPQLLEVGTGAGEGPAGETEDAIKDHNEIRDAIREAGRHEVGTEGWWDAVRAARSANGDHMAEEERDDLADFRRNADVHLRHRVAVAFISFEAVHVDGVAARKRDPERYVAQNT